MVSSFQSWALFAVSPEDVFAISPAVFEKIKTHESDALRFEIDQRSA